MTRKKSQRPAALALLAAASLPMSAPADIYKYVDKRGQVHLADRPLHAGFRVIVRTWKGWEYREPAPPTRFKRARSFAELIDQLAKHYSMDAQLIHAVVRAESAYNPNAVSKAGAVGLMQLMPATAGYMANTRFRGRGRDRLFRHHPQSALSRAQKARFEGLPYYAYDPSWCYELAIDTDVEPVARRVDARLADPLLEEPDDVR